MMADQEHYSSRLENRQEAVQRDMLRLLKEAAREAALDRTAWYRQEGGDSEFAVLPEDVDDARVVSDFVRELDFALTDYNVDLRPEARLRLRVALVHGISVEGAYGRAGQAPVTVARLVNAPVVREILARTLEANLVVVIDDRLYEDVVRQQRRGLRPGAWTRVHVQDKEFDAHAYVSTPRCHPPVPGPQPADRKPEPARQAIVAASGDQKIDSSVIAGRDARGITVNSASGPGAAATTNVTPRTQRQG
jgi:hypothetical protein